MPASMSGTSSESSGGTVRYSVPQAARYLGISERAVRKRIDAGTLFGTKEGKAWVIHLDPGTASTTPPSGTSSDRSEPGPQSGTAQRGTTPVEHDNTGTDAVLSERPGGTRAVPDAEPEPTHTVPPAVDLRPLVDLVADLSRQNRELSEAATIWQFRAHQLEEQLKQLTAGSEPTVGSAPTDAPDRAGRTEGEKAGSSVDNAPQASESRRSWWRRALGV